jgi:hypothetical protein
MYFFLNFQNKLIAINSKYKTVVCHDDKYININNKLIIFLFFI